ncbi:sulfite exporter TauE/SafE family protein [Thaumasiovibrio sp. DFM-14]|uniref:sulfite exporter TauE/SafE family protein n=1 Tax=Thaumasiovibrio sp. DFM-14 TaxID=3384792 RepID=UPI00399F2212
MEVLHTFFLFFGSLVANTLAALSGGGAGLLQLPLLLFLGLPFSIALATHKVATVALGFGAATKHIRAGTLNKWFTIFVVASGSCGVIIGANIILAVPGEYAEKALGILIIGLAFFSHNKKALGQYVSAKNRHWRGMLLGGAGLAIIGIINGSLTAGSGLFVTLFLIWWFGFDYKQAVALTMVSVGLFWNAIGAFTIQFAGGEFYWPWLPVLLLASLFGGYLGAHLSQIHNNQVIKKAFELLSLIVGIKLLL